MINISYKRLLLSTKESLSLGIKIKCLSKNCKDCISYYNPIRKLGYCKEHVPKYLDTHEVIDKYKKVI